MKEYPFKDAAGNDFTAKVTEDNTGLTVEVFRSGEANALHTLHGVDETLTIDGEKYELRNLLYYSYVYSSKELAVYASQTHKYDEFDGDTGKIEAVKDDSIRFYCITMTKEIADMIADAISL